MRSTIPTGAFYCESQCRATSHSSWSSSYASCTRKERDFQGHACSTGGLGADRQARCESLQSHVVLKGWSSTQRLGALDCILS
eukprot:14176525-Alexandrium_andersonii.AAC.1